jgi:hypothetical protein
MRSHAAATINSIPESLEALWWVMHRSDDESRQVAAVTCYLDESGTHEGAAIAVVGGILLDKSRFCAFEKAWNPALATHSIVPPLHMKDFRRPEGRLANVSNDNRRALFSDVAKLINEHKIYSIAATMRAEQYHKYFGRAFRSKGMSTYGACFMLSAIMVYKLAKQNKYTERIAFLMDSGNQYADHVRGAHAAMQEKPWKVMQVGSLTFDKDELWSSLQAADVISWASRVRAQGDLFNNGYEPLDGLFNEAHSQETYPEKAIIELADSLDSLQQSGKFSL